MSGKNIFFSVIKFFTGKGRCHLIILILLGLTALGDFVHRGLIRRTFVFYFVTDRSIIVEDRMLRRSGNREDDMTWYVAEFLLGPELPDLAPLFPRETRLRSLLYREGVVYVDLSESAALPFSEQGSPVPGQGVFESFEILYQGIRRNFPYVRDVRLFAGGNAAFAGELGKGKSRRL
ncbi:MAG: GerMN domain-containing protein [Treponema sp.]|jgi:hypothetical protein|nr:GerMN domain-containing protein [Treponema sp.]